MARKKRHSAKFKFSVALDAAKEVKTLNELSSQHGIHAVQVSQWKKQLLEGGESLFTPRRKNTSHQKKFDELHRILGELTVERDWLKKKLCLFP